MAVPAGSNRSILQIRKMNYKRKAPKQRSLNVKKPCLRDEKAAANALLMLAESPCQSEKPNDDVLAAETLLTFTNKTDDKVDNTKMESTNIVLDTGDDSSCLENKVEPTMEQAFRNDADSQVR